MQLSVYKKFNGRTVREKTQGYIGKKKSEGQIRKVETSAYVKGNVKECDYC
jgi:hypothetical protein